MSSSEAGGGVSKPKVLPTTSSGGIYNRRFRNQVRRKKKEQFKKILEIDFTEKKLFKFKKKTIYL